MENIAISHIHCYMSVSRRKYRNAILALWQILDYANIIVKQECLIVRVVYHQEPFA